MKYNREEYTRFLETEIEAQISSYEQVVNTNALVLKERGEIFVGKFLKIQSNGQAIFKVRRADSMPRKNSFWTATYFVGEMAKYKKWGNISWIELREKFQKGYSDANCIWISKSEEDDFCLVGIKGLSMDFARLLEQDKPIIAFGPKDPPLKYLYNLIDIVADSSSLKCNSILDYDEARDFWSPVNVGASSDLNSILTNEFSSVDYVVIQGPPGTGKTYRMAKLAALLLKENKSVLVTALTNQALMELAKKEDIAPFLEKGRVSKTSLTVDENRELPKLQQIIDNKCNSTLGNLSLATFYVASGWAIENGIMPFDYVIMDEASQALLPMIAASVKLGKKIIWIGDQNQLPPIVLVNEDLINRYNWYPMIKGFETICRNFDYHSFLLSDTFRLTKRGATCTGVFYNNQLNSVATHQSISLHIPELEPLGGPILKKLNLRTGDKSPSNAITFILDFVYRLLRENSSTSIAILSKFRETVRSLQKSYLLSSASGTIPENVKIETVDRVQGLTVDYCVFLIPNASVKYSLDKELFNVATSRAKYSTIIVADSNLMQENMQEEVKKYLLLSQESEVQPQDNEVESDSNSVNLKIKGKIDLSQFETPKQRAVKSNTKKNIYIIDTNVFVECPEIISKIDEKFQIVLSAKVIDELDKLKITLDAEGKRNVEKALRNINRALDKPHVSMELSDATLLPSDFNRRSPDNNILTVALKFKQENPILLTSDNGLQVKAKGLNIATITLKEFLKR